MSSNISFSNLSMRLAAVDTAKARAKLLDVIATELADACLDARDVRKMIHVAVKALEGLRSASALAVLIFEQLSQNNVGVAQAFKDALVQGR